MISGGARNFNLEVEGYGPRVWVQWGPGVKPR